MSASRQLRRKVAAATSRRRRGRPPVRAAHVALSLLGKARTASSLTWAAGVTCLVAVTTGLVVLLTAGGQPTIEGGRYLAFTSCLLTDPRGLAAQPAAAAWAGMQRAAAATKMQAQYLQVPAGIHDVSPYLATLVMRHCGVIVAAGPVQAAAVQATARRHKHIRFVVTGGHASGTNITLINGPTTAISAQVSAQVTAALHASG